MKRIWKNVCYFIKWLPYTHMKKVYHVDLNENDLKSVLNSIFKSQCYSIKQIYNCTKDENLLYCMIISHYKFMNNIPDNIHNTFGFIRCLKDVFVYNASDNEVFNKPDPKFGKYVYEEKPLIHAICNSALVGYCNNNRDILDKELKTNILVKENDYNDIMRYVAYKRKSVLDHGRINR